MAEHFALADQNDSKKESRLEAHEAFWRVNVACRILSSTPHYFNGNAGAQPPYFVELDIFVTLQMPANERAV